MATTPHSHMGTQSLGPSDFLIKAFRAYPKDPTEEIKIRLSRMLQEFMQHCQTEEENETNRELVEKCCRETEICYYKILEDIVQEPKWRADILIILYQELIQGCLVACCLDITMTSNQLPCDFTVLLQIFKLAAYHFPLVIELVMQSWKDHSSVKAKHLHQIEIKILERLAWTSDSLLWKEIRANDNRLPACQEVMSSRQLEDPKRPAEADQPQAPVSLEIPANVDHQCSSSATTRPQKNILKFACKVYKRMACRLSDMCSKLGISDELRGNIWTCFEYSLVHCNSLMVDSHLDLLLLYTIFNMTKITNTNLTLNDTVSSYKSQQYATKTVWEDMLILGAMENLPTEFNDEGDHTGITLTPITPSGAEMKDSLIHFHQDYRKKMQHCVQRFAPNFGGDTPQSPYPLLRKKPAVSRRLRDNISISLLTESNCTHTPVLCYHFGSSTSECLREISSKVKAVSRKRVHCAVSFDNVDGEEDCPSSRRHHLDGQSALQRRLKSVVKDRAKVGNQD